MLHSSPNMLKFFKYDILQTCKKKKTENHPQDLTDFVLS